MKKDNTLVEQPEDTTIKFITNQNLTPILELKGNGDIFVKGKLVTNDMEVVDALREFISYQKSFTV